MKQVYAADTGTPAMQEVAQAVREGANAYLRRQFTVVGVLIVVLTVVIVAGEVAVDAVDRAMHIGRANCR